MLLRKVLFLILLKSSLQNILMQDNCPEDCSCKKTNSIPDTVTHIVCHKKSLNTITVRVVQMKELTVFCRKNMKRFEASLPQLDETFVDDSITLYLDSECPFPRRFSELSTKLGHIKEMTYQNSFMKSLSFETSQKFYGLNGLFLTNDQIRSISPMTFFYFRNLTDVDLSHNFISDIKADLFEYNHFLKNVSFRNNTLISIDSRSLADKRFLRSVVLSDNKGIKLPPDLLLNSVNTSVLVLSGTNLSSFDG